MIVAFQHEITKENDLFGRMYCFSGCYYSINKYTGGQSIDAIGPMASLIVMSWSHI